jgi:hypothetical protein
MQPLSRLSLRATVVIAMLLAVPHGFLMGQADGANTNCTAEHYKVVPLPLRPASINEARQVAGTTASHRAGLWTERSGLRELPLPAGFLTSEGVAINTSGHIVGVVYGQSPGKHQAFIFSDAVTLLPGAPSRPNAISDSDEVVGESILPGKSITGPVSWTRNMLRPLGGCCGGSAKGINKNGEAIGEFYDETGRYQAFFWNVSHGIQPIGPPDSYSSAIAMNEGGDVVVQAFSDVFLYAGGKLTRLDLSPLYPSQPRAINDCGAVVGSFGPFFDAERAFIWEKTRGFRDLNSRIAPDSGWKLESATSINNHGEIVGRGDYKGEDDTGFLLIPER